MHASGTVIPGARWPLPLPKLSNTDTNLHETLNGSCLCLGFELTFQRTVPYPRIRPRTMRPHHSLPVAYFAPATTIRATLAPTSAEPTHS